LIDPNQILILRFAKDGS